MLCSCLKLSILRPDDLSHVDTTEVCEHEELSRARWEEAEFDVSAEEFLGRSHLKLGPKSSLREAITNTIR